MKRRTLLRLLLSSQMLCSAPPQSTLFPDSKPGKYLVATMVARGKVSSNLTYRGELSAGCGGAATDFQSVLLTVLEDMIKASIDPNYIVPTPPDNMGSPEQVIYDPSDPVTLQELQDFLNQYYTDGTPNPVFQANVECLVSYIFVSLQDAIRRANDIASTSFCSGNTPFMTSSGNSCLAIGVYIS